MLFSSAADTGELIDCVTHAPYDVVLEHLLIIEYQQGKPMKEILELFDHRMFYSVVVLAKTRDGHVLHKRITDYCREFPLACLIGKCPVPAKTSRVYNTKP